MRQRAQLRARPVVCWWRGDIYERTEGRVSLHTRCDRVPEIVALARREHPYEVPGISTRAITDGNPDYLAWIA